MKILSIIFVFLVMVLSVLLVGLIVPLVHNVDHYKQQAASEKAKAETYRLNAQEREVSLLESVQAATAQLEQVQSELANSQASLSQKDQSIQQQAADLIRLRTENAANSKELGKLASSAQTNSEIISTLNEEVKDRRQTELDLKTRNVELVQALNERTSEVETLEQAVRLSREQIADLERQNNALAQRVGPGRALDDGESAAPLTTLSRGLAPEQPIHGVVTEVQQIGDATFLSVNVGTNDGVRESMEFMIYEADQYLGTLIITRVDQNAAAGEVTLKRGVIRANRAQVHAGGTP